MIDDTKLINREIFVDFILDLFQVDKIKKLDGSIIRTGEVIKYNNSFYTCLIDNNEIIPIIPYYQKIKLKKGVIKKILLADSEVEIDIHGDPSNDEHIKYNKVHRVVKLKMPIENWEYIKIADMIIYKKNLIYYTVHKDGLKDYFYKKYDNYKLFNVIDYGIVMGIVDFKNVMLFATITEKTNNFGLPSGISSRLLGSTTNYKSKLENINEIEIGYYE